MVTREILSHLNLSKVYEPGLLGARGQARLQPQGVGSAVIHVDGDTTTAAVLIPVAITISGKVPDQEQSKEPLVLLVLR